MIDRGLHALINDPTGQLQAEALVRFKLFRFLQAKRERRLKAERRLWNWEMRRLAAENIAAMRGWHLRVLQPLNSLAKWLGLDGLVNLRFRY